MPQEKTEPLPEDPAHRGGKKFVLMDRSSGDYFQAYAHANRT
jgi:hypothetical protein